MRSLVTHKVQFKNNNLDYADYVNEMFNQNHLPVDIVAAIHSFEDISAKKMCEVLIQRDYDLKVVSQIQKLKGQMICTAIQRKRFDISVLLWTEDVKQSQIVDSLVDSFACMQFLEYKGWMFKKTIGIFSQAQIEAVVSHIEKGYQKVL
jgi:hypothetical protein